MEHSVESDDKKHGKEERKSRKENGQELSIDMIKCSAPIPLARSFNGKEKNLECLNCTRNQQIDDLRGKIRSFFAAPESFAIFLKSRNSDLEIFYCSERM
ncbi:Bifunctional premutilin synthase [Dirofilaria immitis]